MAGPNWPATTEGVDFEPCKQPEPTVLRGLFSDKRVAEIRQELRMTETEETANDPVRIMKNDTVPVGPALRWTQENCEKTGCSFSDTN